MYRETSAPVDFETFLSKLGTISWGENPVLPSLGAEVPRGKLSQARNDNQTKGTFEACDSFR